MRSVKPVRYRPTRFKELGYRCDGPSLWRIYDIRDDPPAAVGPFYKTKAELLADLDRYAAEFGCEGSTPKLVGVVADVTEATIAVRARLNCSPEAAREIAEAVLRNAGVDVVEQIIEGSYGAADACVIDGKKSFYIDLDPALDGKKVAIYIRCDRKGGDVPDQGDPR